MVRDKIFPAIRRKCPWADRVVFQHDGAKAHSGKGNEERMREAGKRVGGRGPVIEVVRQAPNHPIKMFATCVFSHLSRAS